MSHKSLIVVAILLIIGITGAVFAINPRVSHAPTSTYGISSTTNSTIATIPDLIVVDSPLPNVEIVDFSGVVNVNGKARGNWFFEASAPLELRDENGKVLASGYVHATDDWMTTKFVPFNGVVSFTPSKNLADHKYHTLTLVLKNDNPSGDPAKQKELDIPLKVRYGAI